MVFSLTIKKTIINRVTHKADLVSVHIGNTQISLWISMVKEEKTTEFTGVWMLTSLFSCIQLLRFSYKIVNSGVRVRVF